MSQVILIVEDDQAIAELERDYLVAGGFETEIVTSGEAALDRLTGVGGEPSAIVLDIMLPGVDGFTVAREIRRRSEVPIVIVSARQDEIDAIRGLGLGADDYVTKPFSPSELVARVKAHVARYERLAGTSTVRERATRRDRTSVAGVTIDHAAHQVWIDAREVALTAKEFAILELLSDHPGWVYTRDEIYAAVWDSDAYADRSTVTVHIRKLREKIEEDPGDPHIIQTVWGLGYRLGIDK